MKRLSKLAYWLFISALAVLIHCDHLINADEGVILNGAWNIFNGREPFTDYFTFIPPLSSYLVAAAFSLTGAAFWSAKALAIIFVIMGAVAVFRLTKRFGARQASYFSPILFLILTSWHWIINHNFFNLVVILWAVNFLLSYRERRKMSSFIVAAFVTGLSIILLQQKGLAFLGAEAVWLLWVENGWKRKFSQVIVFLSIALIPLALLFLIFPAKLVFDQLIIFPIFNYIEANRFSLALFWWAVAGLACLVWDRRRSSKEEWLLYYIAALLLLSCLPLPDSYHLTIALLPVLPMVVIGMTDRKTMWTWIYLAIFACLFLYPVSRYASAALEPGMEPGFIEYVKHNCPGAYLHAGPFFPNAYYETQKLSASSFDILITGHQTRAQFADAAAAIAEKMPICVVRSFSSSLHRFRYNSDNPVERLIDDKYEPVFEDAWVSVWKMKE
ncbi:MAG: ArnT family glycosyltransferase [Bacillota bacterium]